MRQPFTKDVPLSIYLLCSTSRNRLVIYSSLVYLIFWYPSTKPSQTGPQYKRHTAYCSKSKDRTRLRSYRVCSAAKIKYNYCAPCQQCVRKGVRCVYDLQRSRRGQTGSGSKEEETASAVLVPATAVSQMSESTPSGLVAEGLRLGVESNDLLKRI